VAPAKVPMEVPSRELPAANPAPAAPTVTQMGLGVFAPQFGPHRAFDGGLQKEF
jgi:hypothetical protein